MIVNLPGKPASSEAERVRVTDASGQDLAPCTMEKARRLVEGGRAQWTAQAPSAIALNRQVTRTSRHEPGPGTVRSTVIPAAGQSLLLHICCAPCSTFTVQHLRAAGWQVTGLWFNPNVHPFSEHDRRREALAHYAPEVGLPVWWEPGYEMPAFIRAVVGHESPRERCLLCYRLRLERTATVAAQRGYAAFSSTLLISPYQDLDALRACGEEAAVAHGVAFHFEDLRRGFTEHYRLARAHGLYIQRYCGCLYSEWEAAQRRPRRRAVDGPPED